MRKMEEKEDERRGGVDWKSKTEEEEEEGECRENWRMRRNRDGKRMMKMRKEGRLAYWRMRVNEMASDHAVSLGDHSSSRSQESNSGRCMLSISTNL